MDEKTIRSDIKNVREIVSLMEEAFNNLKDIVDDKEELEKDIKEAHYNYCNSLLEKTVSKSGAESAININNIKLSVNKNHYDEDTIRRIYQYKNFINIHEHAKEVCDLTSDNLEKAFKYVKPLIGNVIIYTLSTKADRQLGVRAYQQIRSYYDDGYVKQINVYMNKIHKIDTGNYLDDFKNNEQEYVDILNRITKTKNYIEEDAEVPDFNRLRNIEEKIDIINQSLNKSLKYKEMVIMDVNVKAYNIASDKANEILKEISVDELNQGKKGIKTAPLRNNGITTVYDVLKKSEWDLSSISGVSDTAASVLLNTAKEFEQNAYKAVKVRLNEDDKNEASTALLGSIYAYIQNKDVFKKLDEIDENYGSMSRILYPITSLHDDEVKWLTATKEEKEVVSKAYTAYEKIIKSNIYVKSEEIHKEILSIDTSIDNDKVWDYFRDNTAEVYSELEETVPGLFSTGDTYYGLPEDLAREVNEETVYHNGLSATLRRYQEWGVKYILHQKKVLLGDEMGLGKTVQAIAAMTSLRNTGEDHFIVVCPASVMVNWCREIEKFSILKAIKVHGDNRDEALLRWIKEGGVAVTTYETTGHFILDEEYRYGMLVVDEAHYVKNPQAQRTQNVIALSKKADRILYMTGTALENRVDEMVELVSQLNPELASEIQGVKYLSTAERFKEKLAAVYYRRKRLDVLTELPDITINKEWCTLNEEEKKVYQQNVLSRKQSEIRRVSWNAPDMSKSCKLNRMKEIVEEAKDDGRKVIFFSFFLDTVNKVMEEYKDEAYGPINGSVPPVKRQEILDEFNKAEPGSILVAQIIAGGTGLNIQTASVVILAEPQFKPSTENQAISRAYRMGQSRNVLVYRLLCENTTDESVMKVLEDKQVIFDTFANDSAAAEANREIDEQNFEDIISEEIEKIKKEKSEGVS
ncbi:MAG: DEAD/DEAH box helicase [Erysipelotrichaceae bacterium]|nr:DEAD/DEAH box helicase [Erysipelotrichaceae bacterium]